MVDQILIFVILLAALVLFITGTFRYDIVALLALLTVVFAGLVPPEDAFRGFSHPAVIVVGAVLVVSRALGNAGVVDWLASLISKVGQRTTLQVGALTGVSIILSSFVSSVASVAILMPVAIRIARKAGRSPSPLLMPLAFGSLLGAQVTLIGSSPNIIIALFRDDAGSLPFRMFDYTPVGLAVSAAGLLFIAVIGWRLIPQRPGRLSREELFRINDYISEVRIADDSVWANRPLQDFEESIGPDVSIVGLVRGNMTLAAPPRFEILDAGDILVLEADADQLGKLTDGGGLELVGSKGPGEEALKAGDVTVIEAVVAPDSVMVNRTPRRVGLRPRFGVNLLAVARRGSRVTERLSRIRFQPSDVLLLQGAEEAIHEAIGALGCLPLAERGVRLGQPRRIVMTLGIFFAALVVAAIGLLPVQIAFVAAAVAIVALKLISLRETYDSIDWPIIVLLGAMIPVGEALESTGGAEFLADRILDVGSQLPPVVTLVVILVATMLLTDAINNAAAAVLMAPIAVSVAEGFGVSIDGFLMAVAVGASSAFLTPIGHQSNTLVFGPGGYRFSDFWRMGLPLAIVVAAVGVPVILRVWPLTPAP